MKIGKFDTEKEVFIIAEIGNNHEGNFDRACEMIKQAAKAGAHAVKFQTIIPDKLVSANQHQRIEQLKRFQFSYDQYGQLAEVANTQNVIFLSTPFDLQSVYVLNPLVPAFKIASSDNNFYPLLEAVAKTGKPIILSTGLADHEQISMTESFIDKIWKKNSINQEMAILHCVTSYPTKPEEANLLAIQTLQQEFGGIVGYSDHTLGITAATLAVALGARIIEKHFTLDKNFSEFRDHQLSADPIELRKLVENIQEVSMLLGDGSLDPRESELKAMENVRRSIVADCDLSEGSTIRQQDISWVRPGGGIPPGLEDEVIGKILTRSLSKGEKILLQDLKG